MNGLLGAARAARVTWVQAERNPSWVQLIKHLQDLGCWLDGGCWDRNGEGSKSQEGNG